MADAGLPGKPRPAGRLLALGVTTLGVGFAWYYFQSFREVDGDARRRHSPLFFLVFVPVIGPLFGLAYVAHELRLLNGSRRAVGLGPGVGAWDHFWLFALGTLLSSALAWFAWLAVRGLPEDFSWPITGLVVAWFAPVFAVPALAPSINEYWEARLAGAPAPAAAPPRPPPSP